MWQEDVQRRVGWSGLSFGTPIISSSPTAVVGVMRGWLLCCREELVPLAAPRPGLVPVPVLQSIPWPRGAEASRCNLMG